MLRFFCILLFLGFSSSSGQALVLETLMKKGELSKRLSGKKIGYYIGSFDPLHLGHEAFAQEILNQNGCDYILIYPAWGGDNYKDRLDVSIRLDMLFAAFAKHPKIIVTKLNPQSLQNVLMENDSSLISGKPSVKSKIKKTYYIGIVGSDTAIGVAENAKWSSTFMRGIKVPIKYKENTLGGIIAIPVQTFIIGLRQGDSLEALSGKVDDRPIAQIIETKHTDLSSTKVRFALENGESIDNLVNKEVKKIILRYQLYKKN